MSARRLGSAARVALLASLATCTSPGEPERPSISASPASFSFEATAGGTNPPSQALQVGNSGGGTLSWTASSSAQWLAVNPTQGTGGGTITLTPSIAGLAAGSHAAIVTLTDGAAINSPVAVAVTLTLAPPPQIAFDKASLAFSATSGGANPPNQAIAISNSGGGSLMWTASKTAAWLTVAPSNGTAPGTITVSISIGGLESGTHSDTITVAAAGAANSPQKIPVTVTLAPPPQIALDKSSLAFSATTTGGNPANQMVTITNAGGGTLSWTASKTAGWLSLSPSSGTAPGVITASVNASGLSAGTYTDTITVIASGATNTPQKLPVTLALAGDYSGTWSGKTAIDSTVTFQIQNSAFTSISVGWRVPGCGASGKTTVTYNTPSGFSGSSFSKSISSSPVSFTLSGSFSSESQATGNLSVTFSQSGCTSTSNTTWSAARQ